MACVASPLASPSSTVLHTVPMASRWATSARLSTTLVMLALGSLLVAGSFLLAGQLMEKPVAKADVSIGGGIYGCGVTKTPSICGPEQQATWSTTGATICLVIAGVLLAAAGWASLWAKRSTLKHSL